MTSNQTVSLRQKYIYVVCAWTGFTLLFPLWKGVSYSESSYDQEWRKSGVFGLTGFHGFSPFMSRAPIFYPPKSGGGLPATLRLPFMPVTDRYHIELHAGSLMWHWCIGLMIAGLIVAKIGDRQLVKSDRLLNIARATGMSLLVTNFLIITISFLTMGLLLGSEEVCIMLAIGLACGLGVGFFHHRMR